MLSKKRLYRQNSLRNTWRQFIEAQRLRMAYVDALPQLALLGIISGLLSGVIIILFRWTVEFGAATLFPMEDSEGFEVLPPQLRLVIAVAGGLMVGLLLHFVSVNTRQVGVTHVIERLNLHQGHLPFKNALLQFTSAALSIVFGHSVGREGPNIHLGATSGSLLARKLGLPNNSVRTLVGCGVAAAIAAGFNTPLAGVIFAMEVVLMEYTIIGFVPIILAAVSATALTRLVFGEGVHFFVYAYQWNTLNEFFYVLVLGVAIGIVAAVFIRLTVWISTVSQNLSIWLRLLIAGVVVGLIAVPIPQVMGIGYDTVNAALLGEMALATLAVIVIGKLLATSACIGLGSPGGLIGPSLFIGAAAGGALGWLTINIFDAQISHGAYAMLGMGAMMAATLQAPLAALLALLELTANPNLIMPGMTAVVSAVLVTRVVFGCPSIYQLLMQNRGLHYRDDPVTQALRRISVARVMHRKIIEAPREISQKVAVDSLHEDPHWIVVRDQGEVVALLSAPDLAHYVEEHQDQENIDLMEIPAMRKDLVKTSVVASLQDALELLEQSSREALYVTGTKGVGNEKIYGVLTKEDIEKAYRI